jgi:two-component system nitrate/nitrite response regulator NarL
MNPHSIKVIIADDHLLFVEGLVLLLKDFPDIAIIDIAADWNHLEHLVSYNLPDVILTDINMPKVNGLDALLRIRKRFPAVKIIVLSTYNEDHLIKRAKEYGANGYKLKNCGKAELADAIRSVYNGENCFPVHASVSSPPTIQQDPFLKQFKLTAREVEVARLIKTHLTNQQIAEKLHLSIYTVETHRKNIMQKLDLRRPSELIKFLLESGF